MECDLTLNGIDVVITTNQDDTAANQASNSEESSTTSSTVNTPIENVNRTFAKSLIQKENNESSTVKSDDDKINNNESSQAKNSDVKSLVSNSSQSTLTDHADSKDFKDNNLNKELYNLPWNSTKKDRAAASNLPIDKNIRPGEFVLRTLFSDFTSLAEKKIDAVLVLEAADKPLSKLQLQRGEDPIFDQMLSALGSVAEHCLPSLLKTLFAWYERQLSATQSIIEQQKSQQQQNDGSQSKATGKVITHNESQEKNEIIYLLEKRDLCIEFIFCLFLIEVLKQLPLHPGHDELILYIETLAFKQFKYTERSQTDPNVQNFNIVADLYAEVLGVLAQSRFQSVRKRFMAELDELRSKEASSFNTYSIISLLMGMKFFRIKMVPIQEFEASFQFMQEMAHYFLEVKDKDIKHTLAGLLVEILLPVAATVKTEVNITCLKNFVDMLFSPTLDLCTKKKHMLAICPLVTCLLCVSQRQFFIQNWHYFLAICLSNLKNRDQKISRVALESLYRLLWVYMMRIKCESNTATQSKLHSIVNSLFPKGSKSVVPRDTPLNIFVKIIQFIAQERLDFAMKEIVFDLLSVGRHFKIITAPERMSIGLRAFLVVADSLQQKEGEPPMPRNSVLPSGNAQRIKKTYLNKLLTDQMAKNIGIDTYYPHVKKVLNDILKALDSQLGRPLMKTTTQNINKEFDEMITDERKPKIDLFRICIAAIPRLIPEGMTRQQLIELLSRLTIHIDDELSGLAFQSLQNIINDFEEWRTEVIDYFISFILHEVNDTFNQLLDNSLRILLQLLTNWKLSLQQTQKQQSKDLSEGRNESTIPSLHKAEAVALIMMCSYRQPTRRLSALILKECRSLLLLFAKKNDEKPILDVIDKICPQVVENCMIHISANERQTLLSNSLNVDLQWLADRTSASWVSDVITDNDSACSKVSINEEEPKINAWLACLMEFLTEISNNCSMTTYYAWYYAYQRMNSLFLLIENNVLSDNRASVLLRGASSTLLKKTPCEKDVYLALWKNFLMLVCRIAPSSSSLNHLHRTLPHELSSSPDSISSIERSLEIKSPLNRGVNVSQLFKTVLPLIRSEQNSYLRMATVLGLSYVNPNAIKELMEEMVPFLREAVDRKQENMRRRKRRDMLRLQLGKLLYNIAEKDTFGHSKMILDSETGFLSSIFVEYIEGMWFFLENEGNKEIDPQIREIKQQFAMFVTKLISSFNVDNRTNLLSKDLRRNLFYLFASLSGHVTLNLFRSSSMISKHRKEESKLNEITEFSYVNLKAMCSVLCCGSVFADHCLREESSYFDWLYMLLNSTDERLRNLGQETVILLLESNPDEGTLLDWLVECCFTKSAQVADICFKAIATIFTIREYPCDHYISIINVTLLNVGSPRSHIHQLALELLHQLDNRFFDSKSVFHHQEKSSTTEYNLDEEHLDEFDIQNPLTKREEIKIEGSPFKFRRKNEESKRSSSSFEPLLENLFPATQLEVSKRMSILHPEITMAIFSEITHRFQTARPAVCQNMLAYLIPWLFNMELVDSHLSIHGNAAPSIVENLTSSNKEGLGWGSIEATEMVLNNLFYITCKFGDLYPKEIEDLWIALSSNWLNNMRVIIRYLFIITGLSPNELLPYSKRVAIFMVHARPERLIDELMFELQTVESLNCVIERTETPPFYRITNTRKCSSHSDEEETTLAANDQQLNININAMVSKIEQGTLHTKRHSTESSERLINETMMEINQLTTMTSKSEIYNSSTLKESLMLLCRTAAENYKPNTPQPHPLPMPEYGGFYAPLTEYLPDSSQPILGFHRCNLALMLLTDIVLDGIEIDLTPHIPLMIHIIFLGLDHHRSLVHEHCKALLINMLLVLTKQKNLLNVFKIIVNNQTQQLNYGLVLNNLLNDQVPNFIDPPTSKCPPKIMSTASSRKSSLGRSKNIDMYFEYKSDINLTDDNATTNSNKQHESFLIDLKNKDNLEKLMIYLIHFLSSRPNKQLWNCEDITAKVWHIRSADQISYFLQFVLKALEENLPNAHVAERWAEHALQLALSCSSRHYAGRSLQIFRAIKMPINSRILSDILSRLVETVAEQGEDMQGYVTELMLTLESSVETLNSDQRIISDFVRDLFKSTPNLMNKGMNRKSAPPLGTTSASNFIKNKCNQQQNIDYRNNNADRMFANRTYHYHPSQNYQIRHRSNTDSDMKLNHSNVHLPKSNNMNATMNSANILNRSRSAQSLKGQEQAYLTPEDRNSLLVQFFMISVAMLETDYEHEFLLALRLMDKVLNNLQLDSKDCQEKIEKILIQSKWSKFQGVHSMVIKGITSTTTYEPTIMLLHRLTLYLELPIIDPSESINSFPFNVMALLPYMLLNYNEPNALCTKAAEEIAHWCTEKSNKLENLATVMTLYSRRSFSKECYQWTKCVVKYLYDAYSHAFLGIINFLTDVSEKQGPSNLTPHIMSILHCILDYVDVTSIPPISINNDLNKIISKYVEGTQWKDSLKILKHIVTRSSTLAAPPSGASSTIINGGMNSVSSSINYPSSISDCLIVSSAPFTDTDSSSTKHELPGRTIEFSFDLNQTPIVGRKLIDKKEIEKIATTTENSATTTTTPTTTTATEQISACSPRRSLSYTHSFNENTSNWRRPWSCQSRVRDKLVGLLTSFGQRVGLPKSPSVIFSQNSDIIDRQSSLASSTEEISAANNEISSESKIDDTNNPDQFGLFKEFDFLEYELGSQQEDSMDNFNWGVRRPIDQHDLEQQDALDQLDRLGSPCPSTLTHFRKDIDLRSDLSSEDEEGSVSSLFNSINYNNELVQELQEINPMNAGDKNNKKEKN